MWLSLGSLSTGTNHILVFLFRGFEGLEVICCQELDTCVILNLYTHFSRRFFIN
jgi:hypothetical protein